MSHETHSPAYMALLDRFIATRPHIGTPVVRERDITLSDLATVLEQESEITQECFASTTSVKALVDALKADDLVMAGAVFLRELCAVAAQIVQRDLVCEIDRQEAIEAERGPEVYCEETGEYV